MRSLNKRAVIVIGCFVLALVFLVPPVIHGDEWNLATRFTVNHAFEVPGMVLQSDTPYVIRLYDSPANRTVVQIYNDDQTKMLTMFMAISDLRLEPADKTTFTFIETQPGFPLPMKEWFYPGRLTGLEFVYPKNQALEIARHAREPILSASSTDLHQLNSITVEAIGPVGTQAPVTSTAANVTKSENTTVFEEKPSVAENQQPEPVAEENQRVEQQESTEPVGQIAQNDNSNLNRESEVQEEAAPAAPAAPAQTTENRELPRTAGELPLIALIGVLCLGGGLGLKVISTRS